MTQFNLFVFVKGADVSVRQELISWNSKAGEYLHDFFDGDLERIRGTQFGDSLAKIVYITERSVMEPALFRGVRDVQNRLHAGAVVETEIDCLFVDALANAPWNVLGSQPKTVKGAATSLVKYVGQRFRNQNTLRGIKLPALLHIILPSQQQP